MIAPARVYRMLSYHVLGGFGVILITILRISWRISHPPPTLPDSLAYLQKVAINIVHMSFYVLLFVVPISGLLVAAAHEVPIILYGQTSAQNFFPFFGNNEFTLKRYIHSQSIYTLLALKKGHISAVSIHQFWLKDKTLRRMLPDK